MIRLSLKVTRNRSTMESSEGTKTPPEKAQPATQDVVAEDVAAIYIDPVKERRILTKFDWLVMPQFVIIILLGYLDRSNIGMLVSERFSDSITNPM